MCGYENFFCSWKYNKNVGNGLILHGGLVVAATGNSTMHATSPTKPGEFPAEKSFTFFVISINV